MHDYGRFSSFAQLRDHLEAALKQHLYGLDVAQSKTRYRFEHCLRVARIGRSVAYSEGLDPEALEIACLLHDVGKWEAQIAVDHGRCGALLAREMLAEAGLVSQTLGFLEAAGAHHPDVVHEILQGIAMHVDGRWNTSPEGSTQNVYGQRYLRFHNEPTLLSRCVGECDDVDRFSTYRIYDTLRYFDFLNLSTPEQVHWIDGYLAQLEVEQSKTRSSATTRRLWDENLNYQREYFLRLRNEIADGF